jgi:hypothetical protein
MNTRAGLAEFIAAAEATRSRAGRESWAPAA